MYDYHRYYGSALALLIDNLEKPVSLRKMSPKHVGYYLLNNELPLALKYSKKRVSPWSFTFPKEAKLIYRQLLDNKSRSIIAFVCGLDGVAAISLDDLVRLIELDKHTSCNVAIRRRTGQMYSLKGTRGSLSRKVSMDSLYVKISAELRQ